MTEKPEKILLLFYNAEKKLGMERHRDIAYVRACAMYSNLWSTKCLTKQS